MKEFANLAVRCWAQAVFQRRYNILQAGGAGGLLRQQKGKASDSRKKNITPFNNDMV